MRPALLDSNVLFPSVLRDTLLTLAEHELVEPYWSDAILAEVTRALVDQKRAGPDAVTRTISLMVAAFPDAIISGWEQLVQELTLPDPDDRHVLAAAITAEIPLIVTANLRDFPEDALHAHGIVAVHPDVYLLDLLDEFPTETTTALMTQAARYRRPPRDLNALLDRLAAAGAPGFAQAARDDQ